MAYSAVRSYLDQLLIRGVQAKIEDPFVMIVGKGLRSEEKAKLNPVLLDLLSNEFGIMANVDHNNPGRLVVKPEALQAFLARRCW